MKVYIFISDMDLYDVVPHRIRPFFYFLENDNNIIGLDYYMN